MKFSFWPILVPLLLPLLGLSAEKQICDTVTFRDHAVALNNNEKTLICGLPKGTQGWQEIPIPQAELHLKAILQNLGYLQPRFERHQHQLDVWVGELTIVDELKVEGTAGVLEASKKRKVVGYPITTENLNSVESWANQHARQNGYACPEISVQARAWEKRIVVDLQAGARKKYGRLLAPGLGDLNPAVLDRYRPFETGQAYNVLDTQIMSSRLLADSLFQSAFFTTLCDGDVVDLELKSSIGKPRFFKFGIGASTEELPFVDLTFKNTRLDAMASAVTVAMHASPKLQNLTAGSELYWFPSWTRSFVGPRFRLERTSEDAYETNTAKGGVDFGRNWDLWNLRFTSRLGPSYNYTKTVRGQGPEQASYPTLDASIGVLSHVYEATLADQYEGWSASLTYRGQGKGLGSRIDLNRYELHAKHLWNVNSYSPPLFVFGTRVKAITLDADEIAGGQVSAEQIPAADRIFLGGDDDLRGFGRKTIGNLGLGYMSALYVGFELRLIEQLPYHLQPFVFYDAARVGTARYKVSGPLFTSEGIGLRWASPFGSLRGSIAQGHMISPETSVETAPTRLNYFLSFGQEF